MQSKIIKNITEMQLAECLLCQTDEGGITLTPRDVKNIIMVIQGWRLNTENLLIFLKEDDNDRSSST